MEMKTGIIIAVILLVVTAGVYVLQSKTAAVDTEAPKEKVAETAIQDNPYVALRTQAMQVTPEQLDLQLDDDNAVFGIVMDWNMRNAIVTVVSFSTGDASVYISTGQAFIGGAAHETVISAAKDFVKEATNHIANATKTDSIEPTLHAKVDFYFLTPSGKYYLEDYSSEIENGTSDLSDLFAAGNDVITAYRLITDEE